MKWLISNLVALLLLSGAVEAQLSSKTESQKQMLMANLSSMPQAFTENHGQWDEKALFKADAGGATFWFCRDEVAYVFTRNADQLIDDRTPEMLCEPSNFNQSRYKKESLAIHAKFLGSNANSEIVPDGRLSYNCNYFLGNIPSKWATDVPNYSSLTYKDLYQGIDLVYHGNGSGMKYDFIVNPGADISQIKMKYDGVENLGVTANGDLEAATAFGLVHEEIPEIYQEINGKKESITGRYIIIEKDIYGFEMDDYNPNYPLVIDPQLVYSTYLGGSFEDWGTSLVVDANGEAFFTGCTESAEFPTVNPYDDSHTGVSFDAVVTKFASGGNSLVYSTFLGGSNYDVGNDIAIDASGNAYVTGSTISSDFPTVNAYDPSYNYNDLMFTDVFVAKLSSAGNSLIYSTYLGGTAEDIGYGIVVGGSGRAYVTGNTQSTDFPTINAYDNVHNGGNDIFVTKLEIAGNSLVYSTFIGGSNLEYAYDIAIDGSTNAYITGKTNSSDFPMLNAYNASNSGGYDVFVSKLSSAGNALIYSTYLGGSGDDVGEGIDVGGSGRAYVVGYTFSSNFPTQDPYDGSFGGISDAFVSKFNVGGDSLVYSTYLGGSNFDHGNGITVNNWTSDILITGSTASSDFPTVNAYDWTLNGYEGFVTKISHVGDSLAYSTYLGGSNDDYSYRIAIDDSENVYVAGTTKSSDFPAVEPYDGSFNGGIYDAFVAKFGVQVAPPPIGAITGIVTDSSNGLPIEGAFITAIQGEGDMYYYDTTDVSGRYRFPELQIVTHSVEGVKPGYISQTKQDIEIIAGETTYVNFALLQELSGCAYRPGDINNNHSVNGVDIVYAVNYFKSNLNPPPIDCFSACPTTPNPFYAAGDVNGNCAFNGIDLTYFVRYLKLQVPNLLTCSDCPPTSLASPATAIELDPAQRIELPTKNKIVGVK